MRDWKGVILHHSATRDHPEKYDWKAIKEYHINTKGWKDIGYHFGIELENDQVIFLKGRSLSLEGAHSRGFNQTHIGICVIGNWDLETPSKAVIFLLESFLRELQRIFRFPPEEVLGHWETFLRTKEVETQEDAWKIKTCPGKNFPLKRIRRALLSFNEKGKKSTNFMNFPHTLDLS